MLALSRVQAYFQIRKVSGHSVIIIPFFPKLCPFSFLNSPLDVLGQIIAYLSKLMSSVVVSRGLEQLSNLDTREMYIILSLKGQWPGVYCTL